MKEGEQTVKVKTGESDGKKRKQERLASFV